MSSQARKFGTFAGVFTPSILTILGVIMYMRLGWVVGQAGLIAAIGIILFAHIISFSTGLSISSIATDKKIKTGGIYYILSRSLGLPMGGAIGIIIFIGTALSISLYIIGFCECFIGIEAINRFLGLEQSINSYRIIGTIVIISLVIIAYISTSLAIKTQYIILGAIVLSLISIFAGFFFNSDYHPVTILSNPFEGGEPLAYVFAIFFPAVTGFTAGVAMSGDLKDPRKNIPFGTMTAIIVGLLVYISLAIGLAYFVNRDLLLNDKNFLLKIAWFSPLVIAGIWGATLSSALGGILGAPRILQAISHDKITPKIFSKGFGINNEPRNALILTFIIAEAGILIGELNVIARLVSMFYIAAYGFINLAFALERWASSDFRPKFRISKWVGIVGFIACFGVMFKIDTAAMIIALIIMLGIYFFLKKKMLQLDFGDVWQSVWSSIVRSSLHEMDQRQLEERNWRPNIILFSGSTPARPFLIEFGKDLVGNLGFLSNFDLIENKEAKVLFPKHKQSVQTEDSQRYKGVFTRQQECRNFYDGVEMISRTYGFSGIEPNTVLMAWGRQSKEPVRFAQTVKILSDLDLNVLMMDFDEKVDFGKKKLIDLWWRGRGNNGNLSLSLVKFIWLSENWRDSKVRLLIVNPVNEEKERIQREAYAILDNMRIDAEVKVINNQIGQKQFYEIIEVESINSDLTFLGIPEIETGREKEFVENINRMCRNIGTVVLIKASSYFKELNIGVYEKSGKKNEQIQKKLNLIYQEKNTIPEIDYPKEQALADHLKALKNNMDEQVGILFNTCFNTILQQNSELYESLKQLVSSSYDSLETMTENQGKKTSNAILRIRQNFLIKSHRLLNDLPTNQLEQQKKELYESIDRFIADVEHLPELSPSRLPKKIEKQSIKAAKEDNFTLKYFKFLYRIRYKFTSKPLYYQVKYYKLIKSYFPDKAFITLHDALSKFGLISLQNLIQLRKFTKSFDESFDNIEQKFAKDKPSPDIINIEKRKTEKHLKQIKLLNEESCNSLFLFLTNQINETIGAISNKLQQLNTNHYIHRKINQSNITSALKSYLLEIPEKWFRNQKLLYNNALLEISLLSYGSRLQNIYFDIRQRLVRRIDENLFVNLDQLRDYLNSYLKNLVNNKAADFVFEKEFQEVSDLREYLNEITNEINRRVRQSGRNFPESVQIIHEDSLNDYQTAQFEKIKTISVSATRLLDYLIQSKFAEPLSIAFKELDEELEGFHKYLKEVVRLLAFSQSDNELTKEEQISLIKEEIEKANSGIEKANAIKLRINNTFLEVSGKIDEYLTVSAFTKNALYLKQYIKEEETKKRLTYIKKTIEKSNVIAGRILKQLWFRQSQSMLLADKLISKNTEHPPKVNKLLNLIEKISFNDEVLKKIPFYYRELFLRKQSNLFEFWVGRKSELEEARKAIERFNAGYSGGILITGDRKSGKSFFSQYFVHELADEAKSYIINPPLEGSISKQTFYNTLRETFESEESNENIFSGLPAKSVIIFDDLELWWEKSLEGFIIIDEIINFISLYGKKYLFILNVNIHTFRMFTRIKKIESYFLNIIRLEPLNAKELQSAVFLRHNSSAFKILFSERKRTVLRQWDQARLFSRYFNFSKGNIGITLQAWIANIADIDDRFLYIKMPVIPDLTILDEIDKSWYVMILQFVLHRRLTLKRLERILLIGYDEKEIPAKRDKIILLLKDLQRAGIINENSKGIFEINVFLYPYLVSKFVEKEML
ncbi:MAG: amino acid permease [Bacteroidetes bacterium]|nr:amino acid permease [Bacteroidota bacterium]MBL7105168.1 amino acid permease [Bacteroidales bacterium]